VESFIFKEKCFFVLLGGKIFGLKGFFWSEGMCGFGFNFS
jgi:hypothetical protein